MPALIPIVKIGALLIWGLTELGIEAIKSHNLKKQLKLKEIAQKEVEQLKPIKPNDSKIKKSR